MVIKKLWDKDIFLIWSTKDYFIVKTNLLFQAATGEDHVIVISTEKRVFSWGKGRRGQLGHDDTEDREKPALIEGLTGKSISR